MAVITISRELAALGDETAEELAKILGYRFVDKSALEQKIKSFGIDSEKFSKYDERKPSLWASLSQDRDTYLHYLKTSILEEADKGNAVFIGRGASAVFRDIPGVLTILLVSPIEVRIERVKSYFHCDERKARQIIEKSDGDRSGFHRYFFDVEWKSPENYFLALNTGHTSPAVCAEMIKRLLDSYINTAMEERHTQALHWALIAQGIKQHILYEKNIPVHFLDIAVDGGKITLYGVANSQALVDATVTAAIEKAAGVSSLTVRSEIQVVREYSILP